MPIAIDAPDLAISLRLDQDAPRAARFYVGQVDHPSPDLRDAVKLLTSDLVTKALTHCEQSQPAVVSVRVWMPPDVVRVELLAPRELLIPPRPQRRPSYEEMLLEQLADRWAAEIDHEPPRMWFEIDRRDGSS